MGKLIRGIIPPGMTPFFDDEIDYGAFREHIRWLFSKNVAGVSVGGSGGEGHTLSEDELEKLLKIAVAEAGDRIIVAGIIRDSTRDVLPYAKAAEQAGADYLMITPIHYFRPNDEAHYAFFKGINDAVSIPIIVYNVVPTAVITPECMKRLATLPRVRAIKQSGGDMHALADMLQDLPEWFPVMSAIDNLLYPSYVMGACGAIAAINTVLPELSQEQFEAVQQGNHEKALDNHNKMLRVWRALRGRDRFNMPAKFKAALRLRGQNVGTPRSPLHPISRSEELAIKEALSEAGAI